MLVLFAGRFFAIPGAAITEARAAEHRAAHAECVGDVD